MIWALAYIALALMFSLGFLVGAWWRATHEVRS